MCALFEAMGAARPQNWEKALDRLQQAAEAGSARAQGQLRALAQKGSDDRDWTGMRAQLSAEKLLAVPPRRMLSDSPRIVSFDGFASEAECKWVIARARDRMKPAKVFSTATGDQTYDKVRDNSAIEFQLPEMDLVLEMIRGRISAATRLPVPIFEPTQILRYEVGQQFRPHHDFLDPDVAEFANYIRKFGQRIATSLVYLAAAVPVVEIDEIDSGEVHVHQRLVYAPCQVVRVDDVVAGADVVGAHHVVCGAGGVRGYDGHALQCGG